MSPVKSAGRKRAGPRKKSSARKSGGPAWLRWWPFALGLVLAPIAVRAVDILALTGPWGARALVPWTFLLQGRSLHLPQGWADYVSAALLWAQFPLYGLLLMALARRFRSGTALLIVLGLHAAAFVVLFAVATS